MNQAQQDDFIEILATGIGAINSFQVVGGSEEAKSLIGETAQLEFKERTCTDNTCETFTDADLALTGDNLDNAFPSTSPNTGEWTINVQFDGRGSDTFSDLTQRIAGDASKRIAIFLDNEELMAPVARAWIPDGRSEITGNFTREEAKKLSIQLESGRLPVPLQLIQESDVDALLGSQSLKASLLAGMLGMALVIIFMRMRQHFGKEEAQKNICEQPLKRWVHEDGSKLSYSDSLKIGFQLIKIYWNY